jgi:hypothetical protein
MVADLPIQLSGIGSYNSAEGWVANVVFRHSQITHTTAPIFALGDPDGNGFVAYLKQVTSGQPANEIYFGSLQNPSQINFNFNANQWYFLSFRYNSNTDRFKIYINGSDMGEYNNSGGYNWTDTHFLQIGGQTESSAIEGASGDLEIGSFILDNRLAETNIGYNYNALFGTGINAKY